MAPSVDVAPPPALVRSFEPTKESSFNGSEDSRQVQTKRNRIQLSCTHCRHAKLKCDREKPCSQCVKKGRASICSFPAPATRKRPAVSMQNRLKHLESLVKGVMTSQVANVNSDSASASSIATSPAVNQQGDISTEEGETQVEPFTLFNGIQSNSSGQVVAGPNESTYVGATHWAAILDDIEEVKSYFNDDEDKDSPPDESVRPDLSLIFNFESPATKEDMVSALPDRATVDRLVYRYFNSNSPALHIIHKPTFQKNYRKFWADPHGTPATWLALLYAILTLATFAAFGAGEENADSRGSPIEIIRTYRGCCSQCLVISNYRQPGQYTLEAFLIYMEGEFMLSKDDQMSCYLMLGVVVRLAMRMGLHRDSDNVAGNITPYQGEFRRRVWHLLCQIDLLASFHIGLPPMVQTIQSDTRIPRNLRDEDFHEDSVALPPSRPETEMTIMSYTLAKGRIARVFGNVIEQANLLTLSSYEVIMALDRELHQAFAEVPPFLRVIPMGLSITDPPMLIIQRLSLVILFHKSRCVLHRKYLMKSKDSEEFLYSKKAGIDAAMELLFFQSEVHDAVQPGRPLCKDKWFISTLSLHDFLLAAMIVYLSLIEESKSTNLVAAVKQPTSQQKDLIRALERSYVIWTETTGMSVESRKACTVLGILVKRVRSIFRQNEGDRTATLGISQTEGLNCTGFISGLSLHEPVPSAESSNGTFNLMDGGQYFDSDSTTPSSGLPMQFDFDALQTTMDPLGAMIDAPTEFDWDVFDNQVRPQQLSDHAWPDVSFPDFDFGNNYNYDL